MSLFDTLHRSLLTPQKVLAKFTSPLSVRCSPNYLLEEKVSGFPPVFQGREEFSAGSTPNFAI